MGGIWGVYGGYMEGIGGDGVVSSSRLSRIQARRQPIIGRSLYIMPKTIVLKNEVAIAVFIRNYVLKLKERTPVSSLPFFPFF